MAPCSSLHRSTRTVSPIKRRPRAFGAASVAAGLILFSAALTSSAHATLILSEDFNDFATLTGTGWTFQNNSSPVSNPTGTTQGWFQGNPDVFVAQQGTDGDEYLGVNYQSTSGTGTISNFAMTPVLTLNNGYEISFYTRTTDPGTTVYPDRLEVRLSTAGTSSNVGSTATSVGDFSTLLLTINPSLTTTGYPSIWTRYTATLSGLAGPTQGRFAFRYTVPNGGPTGTNSDYIGIDTLRIADGPYIPPPPTPPTSTPVGLPSTVTAALTAGAINWYRFDYATGNLVIDTLGSNLGTSAATNDTEIGLYGSDGTLIATNDDIDAANTNFLSSLSFANGTLSAGTYYLAVGAFNTTFGSTFGVTSTSTITGNYQVNFRLSGVAAVPEASSLAFAALGLAPLGVMAMRRRRRSA